jgi:tetratricopeptide (TPR) repeat protein/DNA-binding SARP family transcriptional activator
LLGVLLLYANRVASVDRLAECVWSGQPPAAARSLLQSCVSRLRLALPAGEPAGEAPGEAPGEETAQRHRLVTRTPGYLLRVRPGELDVDRFDELVAAGRQQAADDSVASLERAAELLSEADSWWRGAVLDDLVLDSCRAETGRLEERRLAAIEDRIDIDLRLGRHERLIAELRMHVGSHPLRERLWAQLMLALHGADRQADALAAYRELRRTLVEQLGVEPSGALQRLERAILTGADLLEAYRQPGREVVVSAVAGIDAVALARSAAEPAPSSEQPALFVPARSVPARSVPARAKPALLPAAVASFTGRAGYLEQLDALLTGAVDGPGTAVVISTIAGAAGVGKTALAVHWAHQVRERFPDGQLYINLRGFAQAPPIPPIEALARLLRALGVPADQVPVDLDQAAGMYRSLVADQRLVVLLDNAHDPEQVRPLLPASPGSIVLVTSRDRLAGLVAHDGAYRLTLDVLTADEAHLLLGRIIGVERVAAEPEAAAGLVRACACLPLALRIAAANLTNHPRQSIAGYLAEFRDDGSLASLEADDEQAAVRAAFDLSYHGLHPDARRLFRLLGLVPGPDVTAEAAAALTDSSPTRTRRLLDRLAGAHLIVEHASGRYTFHDLLRRYAAGCALDEETQSARDAAARRLYDRYLGTAGAAARLLHPQMLRLSQTTDDTAALPVGFDDHTQALAWLDAERPNLVATIQYCAEHGPRPVAWLLADILRGYFWQGMHTIDWLTAARAGFAAAEAEGDPQAQAAIHLSLAHLYTSRSDYPQAVDQYARMLTYTERAGWRQGAATALGNLGNVYWRLGRLPEAADQLTRALALNREAGWYGGQAGNLANLGVVYRHLGRLAEAAEHYGQAVALYRRIEARMGEAVTLGNLGETCHDLGRLGEALEHLTRAMTLHCEVGDRNGEMVAMPLLAAVHRDAGDHDRALELADTALTVARETGEPRLEADALNVIATIHHVLGRQRPAIDCHERALALARETGNRYSEVEALIGLAGAHHQLGRYDRAHGHVREALALAREFHYPMLEGQALNRQAAIHLGQGRLDPAVDGAEQALRIQRETGHRLGQARSHLVLGNALRHDDDGRAEDHLRQARDLFAAIGTAEADQVRTLLPGTQTGDVEQRHAGTVYRRS